MIMFLGRVLRCCDSWCIWLPPLPGILWIYVSGRLGYDHY